MKLLDLVDNRVVISPEALELKPFKDLWERDKSKDKSKARAELAFIYFFRSLQSEFNNILEDDDRCFQVLKVIDLEEKPDKAVFDAADFYEEIQTTISSELLKAAKIGVQKIKDFFTTVSLTERDKSGKPIHDADKLNRTIGNIANTVKSLNELESLVLREIETKSEMKGGRAKQLFEDGI